MRAEYYGTIRQGESRARPFCKPIAEPGAQKKDPITGVMTGRSTYDGAVIAWEAGTASATQLQKLSTPSLIPSRFNCRRLEFYAPLEPLLLYRLGRPKRALVQGINKARSAKSA